MPEVVLAVEQLTKNYPNFQLGPITFSLERGSITGCIGRNGAGKSTTIKLITNLIKPHSGSIHYDISEKNIECRIGYLGENRELYPDMSLASITRFIKRAYRKQWNQKKYDDYIARFRLDQKMALKQLSTGNKVKYLTALELSKEPEVLFMDEPTSGLDPIVRDEVLHILKSLCDDEKLTVFFSSHITEDIEKIADTIIYIDDGKIILNATKDEIASRFIKFKADERERIESEGLLNCCIYANGYYILDLENADKNLNLQSFSTCVFSLDDVLIALSTKQGENHA